MTRLFSRILRQLPSKVTSNTVSGFAKNLQKFVDPMARVRSAGPRDNGLGLQLKVLNLKQACEQQQAGFKIFCQTEVLGASSNRTDVRF